MVEVMNRRKMDKILNILETYFGKIKWSTHDPFKLLIGTILSQHTSDKNSHRAFRKLEEEVEINPKTLSGMEIADIIRLIKSAGLANIKAKRINTVSKVVLEKLGGNLRQVLALPSEKARQILISLPGVGEKTADVVLTFSGCKPVIPVDTHLFTIAKRLGIISSHKYEEVRAAYERLILPEKRSHAHLLLIQLGKEICIARKPRCHICPISQLCPKCI
jgi:endonuclease-3